MESSTENNEHNSRTICDKKMEIAKSYIWLGLFWFLFLLLFVEYSGNHNNGK